MKLRFITSKIENQFFFIANLSEWHFSCRLDYNQAWIEETGALSNEEKRKLKVFASILQKHGFTYDKNGKTKYIGKYFYCYSEEKAWEELGKNITKKEALRIKNVFKIFEPRFEKTWNPQELAARVKTIQSFTKEKRWKELVQRVNILFGGPAITKKIFIVVLISPLAGEGVTAAGSANNGDQCITYEIPKLKNGGWERDYSMGVLAHEIAHALFSKKGGEKEIAKIIKKENIPAHIKGFPTSAVSVINEAITESFIPLGYLGQKYAGRDLAPLLLDNSDKGWLTEEKTKKERGINYRNIRKYLIWQLYPLAVIYGRQSKSIDAYFIRQAVLLLKNALGK
ncbi:hypothetical protein HY839_01920 [Candidatus Azambacteria bacterium]|nr:hypothetical protein [Candidatus Azambacteria bacterium]